MTILVRNVRIILILGFKHINQTNQMYFPAIILQVIWVYFHNILLIVEV